MIIYQNDTIQEMLNNGTTPIPEAFNQSPSVTKLMSENPYLVPGAVILIVAIFIIGLTIGHFKNRQEKDQEIQALMQELQNEKCKNNKILWEQNQMTLQQQSIQLEEERLQEKKEKFRKEQKQISSSMDQTSNQNESSNEFNEKNWEEESYIQGMHMVGNSHSGETDLKRSNSIQSRNSETYDIFRQDSFQAQLMNSLSPQATPDDSGPQPMYKFESADTIGQQKFPRKYEFISKKNLKRDRTKSHDHTFTLKPHEKLQAVLKKSPDSGDSKQQSNKTEEFKESFGKFQGDIKRTSRIQSQQEQRRSNSQLGSIKMMVGSESSSSQVASMIMFDKISGQTKQSQLFLFEQTQNLGNDDEEEEESSEANDNNKTQLTTMKSKSLGSKLKDIIEKSDYEEQIPRRKSPVKPYPNRRNSQINFEKYNCIHLDGNSNQNDEVHIQDIISQKDLSDKFDKRSRRKSYVSVDTGPIELTDQDDFKSKTELEEHSLKISRSKSEFSTPKNRFPKEFNDQPEFISSCDPFERAKDIPDEDNIFESLDTPNETEKRFGYQLMNDRALIKYDNIMATQWHTQMENQVALHNNEPSTPLMNKKDGLRIDMDACNDHAVVPYFGDKWHRESSFEEQTPAMTQFTSLLQSDKVMVNSQRNDEIQDTYSREMMKKVAIQDYKVHCDQIKFKNTNGEEQVTIPVDVTVNMKDFQKFHQETVQQHAVPSQTNKKEIKYQCCNNQNNCNCFDKIQEIEVVEVEDLENRPNLQDQIPQGHDEVENANSQGSSESVTESKNQPQDSAERISKEIQKSEVKSSSEDEESYTEVHMEEKSFSSHLNAESSLGGAISNAKSSMASELSLDRVFSEISDESPLQNILDTGRFQKKFKNIVKIGEGGFGVVYRANYHVDQKQYAVKKVRLHILKSKEIDPMAQIYQHRVYRELQAASRITSENIVRYFNSWFEELNDDEKQEERAYKIDFNKMYKRKVERRNRKQAKREQDKHFNKHLIQQNKTLKSMRSSKLKSQSFSSSSQRENSFINMKKQLQFPTFGGQNSQLNLRKSMIRQSRDIAIHEEQDDHEEENEVHEVIQSKIKKGQNIHVINEKSRQTVTSSGEQEKKHKMNKKSCQSMKIGKRSLSPRVQKIDDLSGSDMTGSKDGSSMLKKSKRSSSVSIIKSQDQDDSSSSSSSGSNSSSDSSSNSSSSDSGSSSVDDAQTKQKKSSKKAMNELKLIEKKPSEKLIAKVKSIKSSELSSDDDIYDDEDDDSQEEIESNGSSQFSKITLNKFLKKKKEYLSVNMMIQMEYCSGQSLQEYLIKRNHRDGYDFVVKGKRGTEPTGVIDREHNLQIFTQMINGMAEVHKNNVLHRDLKPENIFIDKKEGLKATAKIGDFGLAIMLTVNKYQDGSYSDSTNFHDPSSSPSFNSSADFMSPKRQNSTLSVLSSVAGTEAYMAPEVKKHFLGGTRPSNEKDIELSKKQDIYQLGLILYEISHKMKTNMQKSMLFKTLANDRCLSQNCPLMKGKYIESQMILHMTQNDPKERPNAQYIIKNYLPKWRDQLEQTKSQHSPSPENQKGKTVQENDTSKPVQMDRQESGNNVSNFMNLDEEDIYGLDDVNDLTVRAEVNPKLRKLQTFNETIPQLHSLSKQDCIDLNVPKTNT